MRLYIAIDFAFVVAAAWRAVERHFQAFFHKALLDSINLSFTDPQNLGYLPAAITLSPTFVARLVAVQQNLCIDDLLRRMLSFSQDRFQLLALFVFQGDDVSRHPRILTKNRHFTLETTLEAVAANGPLTLQAHTDQLEVLADKDVTIVSVNDSISIHAKSAIALKAGQTSITLDGGDITFKCPGTFSVKGSAHSLDSGGE